MKTCPPVLYKTDSLAEQIVFRHLKQAFADKENYVAMHSVQLTDHPKKRFAEIDFLLCTNVGLFVLEVKGGQVSCQSGIWCYKDKQGNYNQGGSPFYQASSAMQGLRQSLLKKFDKKFIDNICFGYGVILTDSQLPKEVLTTLEYDKPMLCQGKEYRNLQKWLKSLFDYWYDRNKKIIPNIDYLDDKKLLEIINFIRPEFRSCYDDLIKLKSEDIIVNKINENHNLGNPTVLSNTQLMPEIKILLDKYYEKNVDGIYFLAKDITIIADDAVVENQIENFLKNLGVFVKKCDDYSFNFRKSYEVSLMAYHQNINFKNKIVIAVLSKNTLHEWLAIQKCASVMARVLCY